MQPSRRRYVGRDWNIAAGLLLLIAGVLVMAIAMSQYVAGRGSSLSSIGTPDTSPSESVARGDWPRLVVTYRMGNTVVRLDYEDARH